MLVSRALILLIVLMVITSYLAWQEIDVVRQLRLNQQDTQRTLSSEKAFNGDGDYWKLYCLTSPGDCFPRKTCNRLEQIAGGGDRINPDETVATCLDFLDDRSRETDAPCLVYSVGVADSYGFDVTMGRYGCEVHSFDPTVDYPEDLAPNVTFHKWGLRGPDHNGAASHFKHQVYGEIDASDDMLTLAQIVERLGHQGRRIDILRMDCEGCEWEIFTDPRDSETRAILCEAGQILSEFHFGVQHLTSVENLTVVSAMFDFLQQCEFKRFHFWINFGWEWERQILPQFAQHANMTHVDSQGRSACCYNYGLLK